MAMSSERLRALSALILVDSDFRKQFLANPARATYVFLGFALSQEELDEVEKVREKLRETGKLADRAMNDAGVRAQLIPIFSFADGGGEEDDED